MSEAIHHDSPDALHYHMPEQRIKRRTASISLGVISLVLAAAAVFLGFKLREQSAATADLRAQLDRANSEAATTKDDLAKSDTSVKQLRGMVDQGKAQQADLQAQVKSAGERESGLQAQLTQAQADLKSAQEKAQAQSTDLQAQLTQATEKSSGLNKELAGARGQVDDLKAQLAKAKEESAKAMTPAEATRELPVTTDFNKSFWSGKFTLQIKNTGADSLKLNLQVTDSGNTPAQSPTVEAGGTFKLDDLAPGAKVVIASEGFKPVTVTAQ